MTTKKPPQKHVIFLGAGASASSGYPIAKRLRLMISAKSHFEEHLRQALQETPGFGTPTLGTGLQFFHAHKSSIDLFRFGGFATVDEFCRLANGSNEFAVAVADMRRLTMLVLGIHNPENNFHKSEYYEFVQRLFDQESLCTLRDEIVVLSFNYDPYLEFLVLRALNQRCRIARKEIDPKLENAVTGGMLDLAAWAKEDAYTNGFAVLKLHGSIARVRSGTHVVGHDDIFRDPEHARLEKLCRIGPEAFQPPIVFPWELFEGGEFVEEGKFPAISSNDVEARAFAATWKRARAAVQAAEKISFVGTSLHHYLHDGLTYLFKGKTGALDVVSADHSNAPVSDARDSSGTVERTTTAAYRVRRFFQRLAPHAQITSATYRVSDASGVHVRCLAEFEDFIRREMD